MNIKLGDLCKIQAGGTPSRNISKYWENGDIPWVKIGDIESKFLNKTTEFITKEGLNNSSAKMIEKGSILYTIFATLGEVCITNIDVTTNQAIAGLTLRDDKVDLEYLYYFLKSLHLHVNSIGRGVAQNNINLTILREFSVPVPNRKKQLEIANILKVIENIIESRKKQIQEYDQLIKSRFVEMFGDTKTNSKKLPLVKPEEICESISAGGDRPDEVSSIKTTDFAYPIFSNGEKDDGLYGWSKEYRIEKPSVTVSGRGTIGYSSYRKDGKFTPIVRLIVMTPNEKVNPVYLTYYLNLEREEGSGSGVQQLTVPMIKSKKIMLPELIKQNKFAEFVEQVDKLKFEVQKSLDESQMLFDSLMQEYFG